VDTIISGGCLACTTVNPCPSFWGVKSCCTGVNEVIATTVLLNSGDSFVDTNGICWEVAELAQGLPTNYDITVDTVYSGGIDNCEDCKIANSCPTEYFLTVKACCDPDRVEIISVPALYMSFSEGTVFSDPYEVCWEVMSYSTTGVETYPINWNIFKPSNFPDCKACTGGEKCLLLYQVRDCVEGVIYTAYASGILTIGSIYKGQNFMASEPACYEVLGYGYPEENPLQVGITEGNLPYVTCEECNTPAEPTFREVLFCDTGEDIVVYITGSAPGPGTIVQMDLVNNFNPALSGLYCVTMGGLAMPQPPTWTWTVPSIMPAYLDCLACLLTSPVMKRVRLTDCCDANSFVMDTDLVFDYGANGTYAMSLTTVGPILGPIHCYTVSLTTDPALPYSPTIDSSYPNSCDTNCTNNYC
jgi:hypothetical protein